MKSQSVLVLGTYANKGLVDIILGIGLVPLVKGNIQDVLDKLRHEQFGAIVVDQRYANPDVLEFILNVRDIDKQIPVVVLGKLSDEAVRKTLAGQRQTMIVEDTADGNKLAARLEEIFASLEGK
jgi:DNA-binding NarL/FixJ family response regulator